MGTKEKNEEITSFSNITELINKSIDQNANKEAIEGIVNIYLEKEVERRSSLIEKGLEKWKELNKSIKKCVPDVVLHPLSNTEEGGDGEESVSYFSENKRRELNSLKKQLSDLNVALIKALSKEQNFDPLMKQVGGKK